MKKSIGILFLTALLLTGCGRDLGYIMAHEPSFDATVLSIADEFILVEVSSDDPIYDEYQKLTVSLDVECQDSDYRILEENDEISVYYDGTISNGKVMVVYAIYCDK